MQFNMGHRCMTDVSSARARLSVSWRSGLIVIAIVMAIAILSVPACAERQTIQTVDIADLHDAAIVTVSSSKPLSLHDFRLGSRYIVFDLYGHLAPSQQKRVSIGSGGITSVRCGWYKDSPPVVRVAVATKDSRQYLIQTEDGGRRTVISVLKDGAEPEPVEVKVQGVIAESTPLAETEPAGAPKSTVSAPLVAVQPVKLTAATPIRTLTAKTVQAEPQLALDEPRVLVASAEPMVVAAAQSSARAPRAAAAPTISLDFVASDIHDVLKALAVQSGINIVASPDVKGNVTVSLNKVSVEEALRLVTNLSGYRYSNVDGTYVVGTSENLNALVAGRLTAGEADRITELVVVRHANPALISGLLEKEFSAVEFSMPDAAKESQGPVTLLLSGNPRDVRAAVSSVNAIESSFADSAESTIMEIYEVKYADISELPDLITSIVPGVRVGVGPNQGFNLKSPSAVAIDETAGSYQGATAGQEIQAQPSLLILIGSGDSVDQALEILARIDVPQQQIVIEAQIVDMTDTAAKDLGIEWGGDFGTLSNMSLTESRTSADQALTIGRLMRSPLVLDARLKAIVASGKLNIVANPNVLALDGKPASIFIGDEVKYVTRLDKTDQGTSVTTETARVGVQLHCISRINSDGYITMDLHPEVSVITTWRQLPEVGLALPEISRRFVKGTVRLKDGETIVIGGLIKDEEMKSMSGIPLLKDLPIIGGLFRYERKTSSRSEIMMFITPRIVPST